MADKFSSKFNVGQKTVESIFEDLNFALGQLSKGKMILAYNNLKKIRLKIPIKPDNTKKMQVLKEIEYKFYECVKAQNRNYIYNILELYVEQLVAALDKNGMYLPSLRDMSNFT